jgi:hypothetical protein
MDRVGPVPVRAADDADGADANASKPPIAISVSPRRSRRAEPEAGSSGCVQLAKIPVTSATTRILPAICSTTHIPPFLCASTASGEFASATPIQSIPVPRSDRSPSAVVYLAGPASSCGRFAAGSQEDFGLPVDLPSKRSRAKHPGG